MFHKHDYEFIAKTYAPPLDISALGGINASAPIVLGMTTLLFKCKKCQHIHKEEMIGKEEVYAATPVDDNHTTAVEPKEKYTWQ